MSQQGLASHGTLIARSLDGVAFTTIGEIGDIDVPEMMRNQIEMTAHNDDEDYFVPGGVNRRGELTFPINFVPTLASHSSAAGLINWLRNGLVNIWRITYPDTSEWLFSGFVSNVNISAPVDDKLSGEVTVRPTGVDTFNDAS